MRTLNLRTETVITEENILPMSGIIATTALKTALAYGYSKRLLNMYYDLIHDLKCKDTDNPLTDGYDLVMTAACYLSEHIGEDLNDTNGEMISGKKTTILNGCYSRVQQQIRYERKCEKRHISDDSAEAMNLSVPFEIQPLIEETERQHDIVDMLIQRMHLTDLQLKTLYCYLAGIQSAEIARYCGVTENTVWESRRSIQKRYTRYIIQGKVHYKDKGQYMGY